MELNKDIERFIIDKTDDRELLRTILPVIEVDGEYLTLEYKSLDGETKTVKVHKNDGEYYTEETKKRRNKELMVKNVLYLMEIHNITMDDLVK